MQLYQWVFLSRHPFHITAYFRGDSLLTMKSLPLIILAAMAAFSISSILLQHENPVIKVSYPKTKKENIQENLFGNKISDPYRWLENDTAKEVTDWVDAQIATTENYLQKVPYRTQIKNRLTDIFNYPKYGLWMKKGSYYFFSKNDGLQNLSVTYFQNGRNGNPDVFFDPNTLSKDGTITAGLGSFSHDNQLVTLFINKAGSDWQQIQVMEVATKRNLGDTLDWVKFSGAAWHGNGFYYSRYDKPQGSMLSKSNEYHKVYYHKLGTQQKEDELVFEEKEYAKRYYSAQITDDERFLIISSAQGTDGNEIWVKNLMNGEKEFRKILPGFKYNYDVIDNDGENLLVLTNHGADNQRVVLIDPNNPSSEAWVSIIPEKNMLLQSVSTGGGKLFTFYLKDAITRVHQYRYDGTLESELELPGIGSVSGFSGSRKDKSLFYGFTSFNTPYEVYEYDIAKLMHTIVQRTELKFDATQFETVQKFYMSKDGTQVPMFITYKKGVQLNGNNPCLLYGYGGFNIALTPSFSASNILFLENGGIYVVANLRGGNEYGEVWHRGGMLLNKQNVFDDFISAAEYLIKEKYTSNDNLAVYGRSNGGLLVGAVMTQRPDLFQVALPTVGVLDMLRYHKFTVGWGWAVEYGNPDDEKYFNYLLRYSPLHNLKSKVDYPATMIITADHDDRVVPAHSFKFGATLQELYKGDKPMLLRIEKNAGHGSGGAGSLSKILEQETDRWSFVFYNLGMMY